MNKILLVDIDTVTANMFIDLIKMHSQSLEIITASHIKEVPNLVSRQKIGMVIVDLKMPDNEDLEFLGYMNRDYPKIPIIVMTAFGTQEIANRINGLESCKYYEKPIDVKAISDQIIQELDSSVGGQIHGIALSSFLQMSEMEKTTCKLKIKGVKETGYMYLLKGALIAAEVGLLRGKDAAFEILSWDETAIEIEKTSVKKKREINMPLMNILMEGLRLKDERDAAAKEGKEPEQVKVSDEIGPLELESQSDPEPEHQEEPVPEPVTKKDQEKESAAHSRKTASEVSKGKSKSIIPIFLGAILVLLIAIGGAVTWVKVLKPGQIKKGYENILAEMAKQATLEEKQIVLEEYVKSGAPSPYNEEANEKIKEIFNLIQERDYEILTNYVNSLPLNEKYKAEATANYKEYLDKFPDGSHASEIKEKIAGISALLDESDFARLQEIDPNDYEKRISAYRTYLHDHPEGKHKEEVEKLISNMGEIYFRYLSKEIKVCEMQKEWSRCAALLDEYISVYRDNRHVSYAKKMKDMMMAKSILFDLSEKVGSTGSDYSKMKEIYLEYLKANPDTPAKDGIIAELTKLNKKIREKAAWDNLLEYSKNRKNSIFDRVSRLEKYMAQNIAPQYRKGAEVIMKHLQEEKGEALRRMELEEEQRRLEAERLAKIEKEKARIEGEKSKIAQQLKNNSRYVVRSDGTVTDKQTGLMWYILDSNTELSECLNFDDANEYVKNLDVGGHRDWRLPSTNDLLLILNNEPTFPSTDAKWYWTSELYWKGYFEFCRTLNRRGKNIWVKGEAGLTDCGAVRAVRP